MISTMSKLIEPMIPSKPNKSALWGKLFWMFLKVNLLSTSGPASVGLLYKEAVGELMNEREFIEAVGFSSVLPGSDAIQLAMFVGHAAGGITGAMIALTASIIPPTLLMLGLAAVLQKFQGESWMQGFVQGLTPAVAALMVVVAWRVIRGEEESSKRVRARALIIATLAFVALLLDLPAPLVLLGAGILGIIIFR